MSKRYGYLFDDIVDMKNIKLAHQNTRKSKTNYSEVKIVDKNLEKHLDRVQELLITKKFTTSEYEVFNIVDKGKEREIYKLPYFPDRIIQWSIMQIIEPIFLKSFRSVLTI